MGNIMNIQLTDYTPVKSTEKVDRAGWVTSGVDNLFPLYLRELAESSPIHGALCISIADMIAGKGLEAGVYQERVDALVTEDIRQGCASDLKKFGGFYIEVIYSVDRNTIAKLRHLPYEECRIAVSGDDEEIIGIFQSDDWANIRKRKNKPLFVPKFNKETAREEPNQVYYCFDYTGGQIYPRPDYFSAVNYIELSKQIGIYHVSNILNGMFPSLIVSFFNGQQDEDGIRKMRTDMEQHLGGARNSGKAFFTFNEPNATPPLITSFPLSDADKQYEYLTNTSRQEVLLAHRCTTPLIFGIRDGGTGFGSNKDEMIVGLEIFTYQVVEPKQRKLSQSFEYVLSYEMPGVEIKIIQNTPLMSETGAAATTPATTPVASIQPQGATPTAEVSAEPAPTENVAASALNGAQIASMLDIISQVVSGLLPIASAKAVMAASFPTLSTQQVDAIFADIVVGTVPSTPAELEATLSLEKKKNLAAHSAVEMNEEDELYWRNRFKTCGEKIDRDEWELIHEEDAIKDADVERQFCENLQGYQLALDDYAEADQKSAWGDRGLYKLRYAYSQNISEESREFCVDMVRISKNDVVYRYEDIQRMSEQGVNGQFAPAGESTYDIFRYIGGSFCHHTWKRQIYFRKREKGRFLPNKGLENDKRVANVPYVEKKGIEGVAPINRPDRGSLKYP
jgi:hypothetical protein